MARRLPRWEIIAGISKAITFEFLAIGLTLIVPVKLEWVVCSENEIILILIKQPKAD